MVRIAPRASLSRLAAVSSSAVVWACLAFPVFADARQFNLLELGQLSQQHPHTFPRDMNENGYVCGEAKSSPWALGHAFLWSPAGGMIDIHPDGLATVSEAFTVNALGQVAGTAGIPPQGDGPFTSRIFRYTAGVGAIDLDIASMGGEFAQFGEQCHHVVMNDRGDVAGTWSYPGRAFLYTDRGGWLDLGPLIPGNSSGHARVVDMNEHRVLLTTGYLDPLYLYSLDDGSMTFVNGQSGSIEAFNMNAAGQFTGRHAIGGGAFRHSPGDGFIYLNPAGEFPGATGQVVTANGAVAGDWQGGAFYWTPTLGMLNIDLASFAGVEVAHVNVAGASRAAHVVGSFVPTGGYDVVSFSWSPQHGVRSLEDTLGTTLYTTPFAMKVMDDGRLLLSASRNNVVRGVIATPRASADFDTPRRPRSVGAR